MNPIDELRFAVSDRIEDKDVSPSYVPLGLIGEFQQDICELLRGSIREIDPMNVNVSIEEGSLALVTSGILLASTLWTDLQSLQSSESLDLIDPKRAKVVERWQAKAKTDSNRRYLVQSQDRQFTIVVNNDTNFKISDASWVIVEKYLQGRIVDWGGKTKTNVHLDMGDGKSLKIDSTYQIIESQKENLVYRQALLHVTAEEHLVTGELRNIRLISFERHEPSFDEKEFLQMVERGTKAWSGIENATEWLEGLRGN
jgi:hypothetical protein